MFNLFEAFEPYEQNMNLKLSLFDSITLEMALECLPDNFEDFKKLTINKSEGIKQMFEEDNKACEEVFNQFMMNKSILEHRIAAGNLNSKAAQNPTINEIIDNLDSILSGMGYEDELEEV